MGLGPTRAYRLGVNFTLIGSGFYLIAFKPISDNAALRRRNGARL